MYCAIHVCQRASDLWSHYGWGYMLSILETCQLEEGTRIMQKFVSNRHNVGDMTMNPILRVVAQYNAIFADMIILVLHASSNLQ